MRVTPPDTAFIIGAGFSNYAGLPLQSAFTDAILEGATFQRSAPSRKITDYLTDFIEETFGNGSRVKQWPELEDIFTNIDLAANSGHYFGKSFSAGTLRTVRRAMISRTIRMLHQKYSQSERSHRRKWQQLQHFFDVLDCDSSAFIVMNWDTVVESGILRVDSSRAIDYGAKAIWATAPPTGGPVRIIRNTPTRHISVVKIHGSTNWLYCDNCRRLYAFPPEQILAIARQILRDDDWEKIDSSAPPLRNPLECRYCADVSLSTRMATFSYIKILNCVMFQESWLHAERLLHNAHKWIFIGYSLPSADYEFKHLLKRVQLSRRSAPQIVLVTGDTGADEAGVKYEQFFGRVRTFKDGIDDRVLTFLKQV